MTIAVSRFARVVGAAALLLALASPAAAFKGQSLAREAKIGIAKARATALAAFPGTITDQELEREGGGSGLRYSFVVRRGRVTHEVGVDARTGRVLENAIEGPNAD